MNSIKDQAGDAAMTFPVNVFEIASSRASYVYAFQHLCKLYHVPAGTPADFAALPDLLRVDERFRGHFLRLLGSMREGDGMTELELLTTVALAFGGSGVGVGGSLDVPQGLLEYFRPIPAEQLQRQTEPDTLPAPEAQPHRPASALNRPEPAGDAPASVPFAASATAAELAAARQEAIARADDGAGANAPEVMEAVKRLDSTREALERRLHEIEKLVGGIARDLKDHTVVPSAAADGDAGPVELAAAKTVSPATASVATSADAATVQDSTRVMDEPLVNTADRINTADLVNTEGATGQLAAAAEPVPASRAAHAQLFRPSAGAEAPGLQPDALLDLELSPRGAAATEKTSRPEPLVLDLGTERASGSGLVMDTAAAPASLPATPAQERPRRGGKASRSFVASVVPPKAAPPVRTAASVPPADNATLSEPPLDQAPVPSRVFVLDDAPRDDLSFAAPSFGGMAEPAPRRFGMALLWTLAILVFAACGVLAGWYYLRQNAPASQASAPMSIHFPGLTSENSAPEKQPAGAPPATQQPVTQAPATQTSAGTPASGTGASTGAAGGPAATAQAQGNPQQEVARVLTDWAAAAARNDVATETGFYAPRLDRYFLRRDVSRDYVRFDKSYFRQRGRQMQTFHISGLHYQFPSQNEAVVTLTKSWSFRWGGENIHQSSRSRLWLRRMADGWKITGEQDLTTPEQDDEE